MQVSYGKESWYTGAKILQKATKRLSGNGGRFLLLSAWRGKDVQYGKGK